MRFIKKHYFTISLLIIFFLGFFLRFWNYSNRFGLAYDQAHDVLVAREALRQVKIPLVGPFSSAGPFQTSGTWYWIIMFGSALYMNSILTPWIVMTLLSSLTILLAGYFGKRIIGNTFGLLLALFMAISTAQVEQSINLTNQTPIPIFSFLAVIFAFFYLQKNRNIYAFCLGLTSAFAASIHLQGVAIALLVFWTFLMNGKVRIKSYIYAILGAVIPFLPLLLWDSAHGYVNFKNMFTYYTKDQFTISLDVLGRRWLTYGTKFLPQEWSHIIGGFPWVAVLVAILAVFFFMFILIKRKITKSWVVLFFTFASMIILVRYMRVPIFSSFITFIHPYILLITAWVSLELLKRNKIIGLFITLLIVIGTGIKTTNEVFGPKYNWTAFHSKNIRQYLVDTYPGKKFSVYDLQYLEVGRSVPFVLYMDEWNLLSENGMKVGFIRQQNQGLLHTDILLTKPGLISDLSSSSSAILKRDGWIPVSAKRIYTETEEWLD